VLQKSGALTDDEFIAIARHPLRGLEMVREIEFLGEALQGILHHHERLDGRGYPLGLAGDAIPEFARMIAVADAFDSMTSSRSYRAARSVEEALTELEACTGTQFDERFVSALRQGLERTEWQPVSGAPDDGSEPAAGGADVDTGSKPAAAQGARAPLLDHDDPAFDVPQQREVRPDDGTVPTRDETAEGAGAGTATWRARRRRGGRRHLGPSAASPRRRR
jgi:hypothetical protein